jgi:hypothetical protein
MAGTRLSDHPDPEDPVNGLIERLQRKSLCPQTFVPNYQTPPGCFDIIRRDQFPIVTIPKEVPPDLPKERLNKGQF